MSWIVKLLGEGDEVSSKRFMSIVALVIIVVVTIVWLFSEREFDTTQLMFIFGFWACVAGYAQYLTILKKTININVGKKDKGESFEEG